MELRHEIIATMRDVLNERDFLEMETPILTRSTFEGARATSSCPAACSPVSWYALPQSPQLFKQLLMMSGYERYYQIAAAASATRICAPIASSSSPSSTSRWPSSTRTTSSRRPRPS